MSLQQAQQVTIQNIGGQGDNVLQVSLADVSFNNGHQRGKELDFTNLYFAQLPPDMNEGHLNDMVQHFGRVISVKILRDATGRGTGTGFARMESKEVCEEIINHYNGNFILAGSNKPLVVKFANKSNTGRYQQRGTSGMNDMGISPRSLTMAVYLQTTQTSPPPPYYMNQPRYMQPPAQQILPTQSQAYCIKVDNNRIQSCVLLNNNGTGTQGVDPLPPEVVPQDSSGCTRVLYQDARWRPNTNPAS